MHRARIRGHYWHIASFAKVRDMSLSERILFSAATRDTDVADCLLRYMGRSHGITHLASPSGLWRALLVHLGLVSTPQPTPALPSRGRLQISHSDA